MQNGSLKIGVVQNYTHTFPYLTTIYQLQVEILQTFNQIFRQLGPLGRTCSAFLHFVRNTYNGCVSIQTKWIGSYSISGIRKRKPITAASSPPPPPELKS